MSTTCLYSADDTIGNELHAASASLTLPNRLLRVLDAASVRTRRAAMAQAARARRRVETCSEAADTVGSGEASIRDRSAPARSRALPASEQQLSTTDPAA